MAEKIMKFSDVAAYFKVSRGTIYDWIRRGIFPKPRRIGPNVFWTEGDIEKVVQDSKESVTCQE